LAVSSKDGKAFALIACNRGHRGNSTRLRVICGVGNRRGKAENKAGIVLACLDTMSRQVLSFSYGERPQRKQDSK
jgi:hypothetical protein